jgi:iron complex transport system substrate-binding protein
LAHIATGVSHEKVRPKVVLLEWLDPFYIGGHWVPEMISRAGGEDVLGKAKVPSRRVTLEEVVNAAPDVMFVGPCGYNAEQARNEYFSMKFPDVWQTIPAVRDGRVYALDANAIVSRPAGRLVSGIEAMAKAMHPGMKVRKKIERAFIPLTELSRGVRSASASTR